MISTVRYQMVLYPNPVLEPHLYTLEETNNKYSSRTRGSVKMVRDRKCYELTEIILTAIALFLERIKHRPCSANQEHPKDFDRTHQPLLRGIKLHELNHDSKSNYDNSGVMSRLIACSIPWRDVMADCKNFHVDLGFEYNHNENLTLSVKFGTFLRE